MQHLGPLYSRPVMFMHAANLAVSACIFAAAAYRPLCGLPCADTSVEQLWCHLRGDTRVSLHRCVGCTRSLYVLPTGNHLPQVQ